VTGIFLASSPEWKKNKAFSTLFLEDGAGQVGK
jgi:hypothetical protein